MPAVSRRQNFQTISWFSDIHKRKLLNLEPPYQRRSVWNQAYKDDFIDTVLLQYPAPAIFLYEEVSEQGTSIYQVVDGKQRLTAVLEFSTGVFPISETSPLSHLQDKYFEQLSKDEKTAFWTYQFPIEYLPTNDETIINGIFQRINKNTARLTRQELRHARFGGLFISAAEELAEQMFKVLPEGFPRLETQSRKQMKDVELTANLLLALEEGIRGYSQDELDAAFSSRESEWAGSADVRNTFDSILRSMHAICERPTDAPLSKTRFRNQADFYSLFTALSTYPVTNDQEKINETAARLSQFIALVENENQRIRHQAAQDYFVAARSNSNDTRPRKKRHDIIHRAINGTLDDYTGADTE